MLLDKEWSSTGYPIIHSIDSVFDDRITESLEDLHIPYVGEVYKRSIITVGRSGVALPVPKNSARLKTKEMRSVSLGVSRKRSHGDSPGVDHKVHEPERRHSDTISFLSLLPYIDSTTHSSEKPQILRVTLIGIKAQTASVHLIVRIAHLNRAISF